eukprot:6184492-Pleurochrysis_carterae.AAC.3
MQQDFLKSAKLALLILPRSLASFKKPQQCQSNAAFAHPVSCEDIQGLPQQRRPGPSTLQRPGFSHQQAASAAATRKAKPHPHYGSYAILRRRVGEWAAGVRSQNAVPEPSLHCS